MARRERTLKDRILMEIAVAGGLVLAGLVLLPVGVFLVGEAVFGDYGGQGFAGFYGALHHDFRAGQPAALFLLLSPCLLWQLVRLGAWVFRRTGNPEV